MSGQPDPSRIKPPAQTPSDQPDTKTQAEAKEAKKGALTAAQRSDEFHRDLVQSLNERISYHLDEKVTLQAQITAVQEMADGHRIEKEYLVGRCTQLEAVWGFSSCLGVILSVITLVAGSVLSYAGAAPGLSDDAKKYLCAGGATATGLGALLLIATFAIGWWASRRSKSRPKID